jgi:hypothetical protein
MRTWTLPVDRKRGVSGLAAVEGGARLYAVCRMVILEIDTHRCCDGVGRSARGPAAWAPPLSLCWATGAAVNHSARALVFCDWTLHCVMQLPGIRLETGSVSQCRSLARSLARSAILTQYAAV